MADKVRWVQFDVAIIEIKSKIGATNPCILRIELCADVPKEIVAIFLARCETSRRQSVRFDFCVCLSRIAAADVSNFPYCSKSPGVDAIRVTALSAGCFD